MVFFIPELLQLICDNCDQSTLVTLALTSRCFYEPAQDILWQDLGNLGPLIRCMPNDLWKERRERFRTELSFCRSIKETDWDRFRANAMRVRRFGSPIMQQNFRITRAIYRSFHQAGETRLLPNVQVLSWPCYGQVDADDVFPYINLFLCPSIRELDIAVIPPEAWRCEARVSLLPSLISLCPHVVSFGLNVTNDINDALDNSDRCLDYYLATYPIIARWPSLQHLCITDLPGEALPDLPRFLPSLQTLEISFRACKFLENLVHLHPEQRFTAMDKLITRNCYYSIALQLVQMMSQTSLQSISLNFEDEDNHFSPEDRQSLFRAMQEHLSYHCLEEISIACYLHGENDIQVDRLHPVRALAPLFPFKNLKKLCICDAVKFDDAAVEVVGITWIHLEHLNIRFYGSSAVGAIGELILIAKHCRALRHLEFAFDATVITEDIMNSICDVRNENLRILNVQNSPIEDHSQVAEVLAKIFPMLRYIHIFSSRDPAWKEVEKLLPMLTTGRITD